MLSGCVIKVFIILVLHVHITSWDIRKHVVAGQFDALHRYANSLFEDITSQARRNSSHLNQWTFLLDMNGYSRREHGCAGC